MGVIIIVLKIAAGKQAFDVGRNYRNTHLRLWHIFESNVRQFEFFNW